MLWTSLPPSTCSVLDGPAGQGNMGIGLMSVKQVSMNPPRTNSSGNPSDSVTISGFVSAWKPVLSTPKWCHQLEICCLKYSQLFEKDLVLLISFAPFHLLVQLCDQLILKLKESEFHRRCHTLRRGQEWCPAILCRPAQPPFNCELFPA